VPGPYRLTVDIAPEFTVEEIDEPKPWTAKGADPRTERRAEVKFTVPAGYAAEEHTVAPLIEEPPPAEPTLWQRLRDEDLKGLLATNYALWLLMLLALVHGAGHSLMPGHGKTMVAAYLVGERGTPRHAVLLGVVTTLTHTSAALAIALLLYYVLPEQSADDVNTVLRFLGGLMIAGIGFWLFLQRLAGRSDHVHLFELGHGHAHGEGHAHSHSHAEVPTKLEPAGTVRLILLGIAGGIIPCWGAIMWVIGCIATGQFRLALPVVLAFSIGLAAVLVLIGLSVVYASRLGKSRLGQYRWFRTIFNERTVRVMPIVGAALLVVIGIFLCATSGIAANGR
jgi:nickel/cobalt exporter